MKAIILAAGNSTRYEENKLLVEFENKTLPEYNIDFCIENNISDIYVTLSKNHVEFKDNIVFNNSELYHPIQENLFNYYEQELQYKDLQLIIKFKFQDHTKYGPAAGLLPWINDIDDNDDVLILFGDNFLKGKFNKELLKIYDGIATYKQLGFDVANIRFAAIKKNTLIEKPHDIKEGYFFCGFMYVKGTTFKLLEILNISGRKEYEITEWFNLIQNRCITPVVEDWVDLTCKSDNKNVISAIKNTIYI